MELETTRRHMRPSQGDIVGNPSLTNHRIIETPRELDFYLARFIVRAQAAGDHSVEKLGINMRSWIWLNQESAAIYAFYALYDEPQDMGGSEHQAVPALYRCIAMKLPDGEVVVMKDLIEQFA
jgi:hypothetical protein